MANKSSSDPLTALKAFADGDPDKLIEEACKHLGEAGLPLAIARQAFEAGVALGVAKQKEEGAPPWAADFVERFLAASPYAPEGFRAVRKALGISQAEIAKLCGVADNTVTEWEHGKEPIAPAAISALLSLAANRLPETAEPPISGADLRKLRKSLGMRQEDLADVFGVTPLAVHKWEARAARPLSPVTMRRIRPKLEELQARAAGLNGGAAAPA